MVLLGGIEKSLPMEDDGSGAYNDMDDLGQLLREALRMLNLTSESVSYT